MSQNIKDLIREITEEILDEMTGTGAVGGYMTPNAFRGKKSKKAATERSMPGGKVVGKEDETDNTTIGEESLPMIRRGLEEGRYNNFKKDESMKSHTKVCYGLREANKMLREIEFLVSICERLKSETGVDQRQMWKATAGHLSEINKRTKAIARRVIRIGKS